MKKSRITVLLGAVIFLLGFLVCVGGGIFVAAQLSVVVARISTERELQGIVEEMQTSLLTERPVRPDQLDLEDINVGDILIEVNKLGEHEILILRAPYNTEDGACVYDFLFWEDGSPLSGAPPMTGFCSDSGLVEYSGQLSGWNPSNYLKESNEDPLTPEQVEGIIKGLLLEQRPDDTT